MKKLIIPAIAILFSLTACGPKDEEKPDDTANKSDLSVNLDHQDDLFYYFRIDSARLGTTLPNMVIHAMAKEHTLDETTGPLFGGTNPSIIFHKEDETLILKSRLSSPLLPELPFAVQVLLAQKENKEDDKKEEKKVITIKRYLTLAVAGEDGKLVETDFDNLPEDDYHFLFTKRRLNKPFTLLETFRGKEKIQEIVEMLTDGITRTKVVDFEVRRPNKSDNTHTQSVTLNLTATVSDIPEELLEYIQD